MPSGRAKWPAVFREPYVQNLLLWHICNPESCVPARRGILPPEPALSVQPLHFCRLQARSCRASVGCCSAVLLRLLRRCGVVLFCLIPGAKDALNDSGGRKPPGETDISDVGSFSGEDTSGKDSVLGINGRAGFTGKHNCCSVLLPDKRPRSTPCRCAEQSRRS